MHRAVIFFPVGFLFPAPHYNGLASRGPDENAHSHLDTCPLCHSLIEWRLQLERPPFSPHYGKAGEGELQAGAKTFLGYFAFVSCLKRIQFAPNWRHREKAVFFRINIRGKQGKGRTRTRSTHGTMLVSQRVQAVHYLCSSSINFF